MTSMGGASRGRRRCRMILLHDEIDTAASTRLDDDLVARNSVPVGVVFYRANIRGTKCS